MSAKLCQELRVRPCAILAGKPALKIRTGSCFGRGYALQDLPARPVSQQHRDVIRGLVQGKNVLERGKPLGFEAPLVTHVWSAFAYITRQSKRSASGS
jgi:hypothetical protein